MTNIDTLWEMISEYMGNELWIALFLASLIIVLCTAGGGMKLSLLIGVILLAIVVFNDWTLSQYGSLVEKATYYRFFWMIPVTILIAFAFARLIRLIPWLTLKAVVFAVLIMTAAFAGFSGTQEYTWSLPENDMMLDEEIVELAEILHETGIEARKEPPRVLMSMDVQLLYRTYDASVVTAVSRVAYVDYLQSGNRKAVEKKYPEESVLMYLVNGYGLPKTEDVEKALKAQKTDFVIAVTIPGVAEAFENAGCERIGKTEKHVVLRCP